MLLLCEKQEVHLLVRGEGAAVKRKDRIILNFKQEAIRRAKIRGEDYAVFQSTKQETLFFVAHRDTKLKDAVRVWPDEQEK